jgi:hypothetical protein
MVFVGGIMCLMFLCGSILILSSFPISLHEKGGFIKKKLEQEDAFSYLFDVYGK